MKCNHIGCEQEAAYGVTLHLRVTPVSAPAISAPFLFVCEAHKAVAWSDVMDENSFKLLGKQFELQGKAAPRQEYSSVVLVSLQ